MLVTAFFKDPPLPLETYDQKWAGPDKGLIAAWLRGIEKRHENPEIAEMCSRGELPVLAWAGGCEKPLKSGKKVGSLLYLATWHGLRGEDLNIDTNQESALTCTRTLTIVTFTLDIKKLFKGESNGRLGD
jgi:hypothetical protein